MDHQPSQNTVSYCGIPKEVGWGVVHFCHHLGPYFKLGQKTRTTVDRRARRESLQGLGAFVESVCNLLLAVQLASYFIILFFLKGWCIQQMSCILGTIWNIWNVRRVCSLLHPGSEVREWEEFAGPFNRVCRGAGPTDNNPAYFEVRQKIPSIEACKDLCVQELGQEGCKGIEYNFLSKRCELWKRKEGIWAFDYPQWEGFTCLRYGWPGKYLIPVTGGLNQACRGPGGQNSESFYVVEAVRHMEDCRARCVASNICRGVEYSNWLVVWNIFYFSTYWELLGIIIPSD